jgi:hypothetical protein
MENSWRESHLIRSAELVTSVTGLIARAQTVDRLARWLKTHKIHRSFEILIFCSEIENLNDLLRKIEQVDLADRVIL